MIGKKLGYDAFYDDILFTSKGLTQPARRHTMRPID